MRGWLRDARSYLPPVQIGEVMRAGGLGEVAAVGPSVKSLKVGDKVEGIVGASYLLEKPHMLRPCNVYTDAIVRLPRLARICSHP